MDEYELELLEKLDREVERTHMARDEQDRRLVEQADSETEAERARCAGGI